MKKSQRCGLVLVSVLWWALSSFTTAQADTITLSGTFNFNFTNNCLNANCSKAETNNKGTGTITLDGSTLSSVTSSSFTILDFTTAIPTATGAATFTAANGDQLLAQVIGTPAPVINGRASLTGLSFVITGGTGVFAGLTGILPTTAGGVIFTSPAGGTGQFTFSRTAAPVPEPVTMLLLGTGLAGAGAWARKRRQRPPK